MFKLLICLVLMDETSIHKNKYSVLIKHIYVFYLISKLTFRVPSRQHIVNAYIDISSYLKSA